MSDDIDVSFKLSPEQARELKKNIESQLAALDDEEDLDD